MANHLDHIRSLPCVCCARRAPSEAAHVRLPTFGGVVVPLRERGGMGQKPDDRWTVPLCRSCHHTQHFGETTFWTQAGINPLLVAQTLWQNSGNRAACLGILARVRCEAAL